MIPVSASFSSHASILNGWLSHWHRRSRDALVRRARSSDHVVLPRGVVVSHDSSTADLCLPWAAIGFSMATAQLDALDCLPRRARFGADDAVVPRAGARSG